MSQIADGTETPERSRLLQAYQPQDGVYDEMLGDDGSVRPHWSRFLQQLDRMRASEIKRRWATAERMIHENGISFNVFADPGGLDRPWEFDGIPLILPLDEWEVLEAGLIQRARLLNAVLADIYGPQSLIREGRLPGALVLGNPQFLRACHGVAERGGVFLHSYAADLARAPDGRWWVVRDSTEAPSGSGFALENRIVLSHCLPEAFEDNRVRRLAIHYHDAHQYLVALSGREDPRIVLLTPGPRDEAFFAHAYIARYLGYTLAEGGDLTTRSDRVYLKTVEGLVPVDVIVRGIESENADPLVLRLDSIDGPAGLTRAVRAGNVVVANSIGSAVVESPALMSFMPALARKLLGQDLTLSNVATWWCGDAATRDHVCANLDSMVLRPAFRRTGASADTGDYWIASALTGDARAGLVSQIMARGHEFVGQEMVAASTTPVWEDGSLRARPVVLRMFVAASPDGYQVLPGGLARIAESDDAHALTVQRGDRSKDTWVLSDAPVGTFSLLRSPLAMVNVRRTGKDLPSRAADNLFWLGRYAERAEDIMRLVRTVLTRLAEDSGLLGDEDAMIRLVRIQVEKDAGDGDPDLAGKPLPVQLHTLIYDQTQPYGLFETMAHLHRTAALVRDRLSLDAWRTLNDSTLRRPWTRPPGRLLPGVALGEVDAALRSLSAFSGLEMENMTRSQGWRFLDMGRRVERAVHMAEILRGLVVNAADELDPGLILLLEVADSFMTYRSRYVSTPMVAPVLDLLMLDETNPRSLAYQLAVLNNHVASLPRAEGAPVRTSAQKIVLAVLTELQLAEIHELCDAAESGRREALERRLDTVLEGLPLLSEVIARTYFSHAETTLTGPQRHFGPEEP